MFCVLFLGQASSHLKKQNDPRYYNIKTPLREGCRVMYRYMMFGYAYGEKTPLDAVWVGYLWNEPPGPPMHTFNEVKYIDGAKATTYIQDGYLYLKVGQKLI